MKLRNIIKIVLLVIIISATAQACSINGKSLYSSSTSKSTFTSKTDIEIDEVEVKQGMLSNYLVIKNISISTGRLTLKLYSPDGQIVWENTLEAPVNNYQHNYDLELTPGIWKLEIEFIDATGSYDIQWKATN